MTHTACRLAAGLLAIGLAGTVLGAPPRLTWQGDWQRTEALGCYHSYVPLEDGRIACFENTARKNEAGVLATQLVVSLSRQPGDWLQWTARFPLLDYTQISDLMEADDPQKPAANRLITRPAVVRLADGSFFGLGVICRGYFPRDGLRWFARFGGERGSLEPIRAHLLDGKPPPQTSGWKYLGKIRGPAGRYMDEAQRPFSTSSDLGNLLYQADGPAAPDHAQPTRNRLLAFPNQVGNPNVTQNAGWTALMYSADGESWFFAADGQGQTRNLTPFLAKARRCFPWVFRRSAAEWWMWQADGWYNEPGGPIAQGCSGMVLYHSPDGLGWGEVRRDVDCSQFRSREGKPLALKNLCTWFDEKTGLLHGMLSVWDEAADGWRKYHNTARIEP